MTKRTPQRETAIIEAYASGKTITIACAENGIGRTTFQEWRRADPNLNRRFEDAQREHAEALMDQSMAIAADPTSDWVGDHCGDAVRVGPGGHCPGHDITLAHGYDSAVDLRGPAVRGSAHTCPAARSASARLVAAPVMP